MDIFKRSVGHRLGIGGWKCYCCRWRGRDAKKMSRRWGRRRLKQQFREEIKRLEDV